MDTKQLLNSLNTTNIKDFSSSDVLAYSNALKDKFRNALYSTEASDYDTLNKITEGYNYFKNHIENNLFNLSESKKQDELRKSLLNKKASLYALGGDTQTNGMTVDAGLTELNGGYKHGQGAYDGIPIGMSPDGKLNVAERGETVSDDYVFSDSFIVDEDVVEKYGFPKKFRGKTISECSKLAAKELKERGGTDNISKNTMQNVLKKLRAYNDEKLAEKQLVEQLKQLKNTRMDIAQEEAARQQLMAQKQAEQQATLQQQHMNQIPQDQMHIENTGIVQSKCGGGINRFEGGGYWENIVNSNNVRPGVTTGWTEEDYKKFVKNHENTLGFGSYQDYSDAYKQTDEYKEYKATRRQQALDRIDKAQEWLGWSPLANTILGIVENSLDGTYKEYWDKTVDYFKNTVGKNDDLTNIIKSMGDGDLSLYAWNDLDTEATKNYYREPDKVEKDQANVLYKYLNNDNSVFKNVMNRQNTTTGMYSEAANRITNLQNKTANSGFLDNREAPVVRSSFGSYTSTPHAVDMLDTSNIFNDFGNPGNHEFSVGGWLGLGISALSQIIGSAVADKRTTPPDYTELDKIKSSIKAPDPVQYKLADFNMPENRKTNTMPIDRTLNEIKSKSNDNKNEINESGLSAGQRLNYLAQNNYNTINSIGNALYEGKLKQIEDADKSYAAYIQNMQMKNAADQYNNDIINRAYQLNSQNDMDYQKLKLSTLLGIEQIKNQQNAAYDAARSSNMSNLFNGLSNIGMTAAYNSFAKDIYQKNGGKIKRRRKHG